LLQIRLVRRARQLPVTAPRAVGRQALEESLGPARRLDRAGLALATGVVFAFTDGLLRGPGRRLEVRGRWGVALATAQGAGPAPHAEIGLPAGDPGTSQDNLIDPARNGLADVPPQEQVARACRQARQRRADRPFRHPVDQ
jgi:hypothetical protein